jgi:hypothetical protein
VFLRDDVLAHARLAGTHALLIEGEAFLAQPDAALFIHGKHIAVAGEVVEVGS